KTDLNNLEKTLAENDLAIKTLAVHDTVADPRIQSFNDLISISKGEKLDSITMNENYRPGIGPYAPDKLLGPRVSIAHKKEEVSYVALTASLASSALEIVQDQLRLLNKPNKHYNHVAERDSENTYNFDDVFFDFKKRKFITDFSDTLKSLDNAEKLYEKPYFFRYCSYDNLDRNYYFFRELALRPLSCLLVASPNIGNEGKKIAQEILKDKEVLKIIKLQFSKMLVNPQFEKEIYLDFKDYLIHNRWSKELSVKDQYDIFSSSLENYVKFYYYHIANNRDSTLELNGIYEALDFFLVPQALNKLSDLNGQSHKEKVLTISVAKTLINILSVPGYLENDKYHGGIWSFAYYIVEYLVTNKDSRFLDIYKYQIQNDSLLEKIELIKKCIALKKKAIELWPRTLTIKKREVIKVWEQLGEDKVVNWFKQYFMKLNALDRDLKANFNQIEKHLKDYENYISHPETYNASSKEYISSKLGALLNTKTIKHFLKVDIENHILEEAKRKQHLKILNKAVKRRRLELKKQKKQERREKEEQRFRKLKNQIYSFLKKKSLKEHLDSAFE
ncbi:expressed protein, partial [Phakopsora pachyrhizi]